MQNKAKVKYAKINVTSYVESKYEIMDNWLFRQTKPKQTQFKPNSRKGENWCKLSIYKELRRFHAL